jgi:hypothetical protein
MRCPEPAATIMAATVGEADVGAKSDMIKLYHQSGPACLCLFLMLRRTCRYVVLNKGFHRDHSGVYTGLSKAFLRLFLLYAEDHDKHNLTMLIF